MAKENWFLSLACNLILPILILNRMSAHLGATNAVVVALLFPLIYGSYYLIKNRKISPVSVLGLLNVMVTGGFALSGLSGIYFAMKEAAFPALLGIFVFFSSFGKKPFMTVLLLNPQVIEMERLEAALKAKSAEDDFRILLRTGTQWLSGSFFISSILNFILAKRIFLELDPNLVGTDRQLALNDQIAHMTGWAAIVIVIPSMILMTALLFYMLKRLEKITGESWQNFIKG